MKRMNEWKKEEKNLVMIIILLLAITMVALCLTPDIVWFNMIFVLVSGIYNSRICNQSQ